MSNSIEFSERLQQIPPYLFVEIDKAKREARAQGRDIIDLGIGDPDTPTPDFIIDAMNKAIADPANHHYALDAGLPRLREAIANWYRNRFGVQLDLDAEVYPLIGSKEGIAHMPLGLINPKEKVLVPEPGYPAYRSAVIFAGGKVVSMPLTSRNKFLPALDKLKDAKLVYINYPNNPTSAVASKDFFQQLVSLAREKGMMIASDLAYSEIYYDSQKPPSILEIEGAKDVAIEFHSLSKTFNMTGWRIGWVCGNRKMVSAIAKVKTNVDSGIFQAIQWAGIAALEADESFPDEIRKMYQERRDYLINGLRSIGWKIESPQATFYAWGKIPKKFNNSIETSKAFLEKANIVVTPGVGFGTTGEGYVRMALTVSKERINEAVDRLKEVL
ncbi:LL-diaminopimelate aminotransferase [Candidatus Omnitrophota bacterium]